jgi:purine-nucleoside phosphorylase
MAGPGRRSYTRLVAPGDDRDPAAAAAAVRRAGEQARVGLILGSGLGELAERIEGAVRTPYQDVPGMPRPGVAGHAGEVVLGRLGGQSVAALRGRVHLYEGHTPAAVAFGVRVLRALGCDTLIVSNAAGGLNPAFAVGDLMAIDDHVFLPGLAGASPLIGAAGERFVSMTSAYDPALIELAVARANALGFVLRRGVYAMVAGPSYETSAELRLLRTIGADAVGMSTAPEVVVARQLGMRVLGVSCITNMALPDERAEVSHQDVLETGERVKGRFAGLIASVLEAI